MERVTVALKLRSSLSLSDLFGDDEPEFSEPFTLRNMEWRIMCWIKQRSGPRLAQSLGIYLVCDHEPENTSWSCFARATFCVRSAYPFQQDITRSIEHTFCSEESDWGYGNFLPYHPIDPLFSFTNEDGFLSILICVSVGHPTGVVGYQKPLRKRLKNADKVASVGSSLSVVKKRDEKHRKFFEAELARWKQKLENERLEKLAKMLNAKL